MKNLFFFFLIFASWTFAQSEFDIAVKGISDSKKDGSQKDRLEAILDAKRQACEKAGLKIESKTTVENFKTIYDFVESQAEAVLLPGFQIIDIGYTKDGTYQVVLSGKIKELNKAKTPSTKLYVEIHTPFETEGKYSLLRILYDYSEKMCPNTWEHWKNIIKLEDKEINKYEEYLSSIYKKISNSDFVYVLEYLLPRGKIQLLSQSSTSPTKNITDIKHTLPNGEYRIVLGCTKIDDSNFWNSTLKTKYQKLNW